MRLSPKPRSPTPPPPKPSPVFRALELNQKASLEVAAEIATETLQARGLLVINAPDARARFLDLLRDRDRDGRFELDLTEPEFAGVVDLSRVGELESTGVLALQTTVDVDALARAEPVQLGQSDSQDWISGFMPLVLDTQTGELRPFLGQLAPYESMITKVHFAVAEGTITLRALELPKSEGDSPTPKVLFRFPDDFRSYKEEGPLASPKERLSLADASAVVKLLSEGLDVSGSTRMVTALALLDQAASSGTFASTASTHAMREQLETSFAATPSKAWLGRQALDLLSNPNSSSLLAEIERQSKTVSPELVFSTMFAEGFNIHWAKRATWKGLPDEGPVYGMDTLGLDLFGRSEALAAEHETATNRDMNLFPPPPPKGPPALGYPTAPTFDALVQAGLLPADFPFRVGEVGNLVEGQGARIVYGAEFETVTDAITAVHATLAFCQERFIRDFDHVHGAGAHEKLSEREMAFAISSYYNGGWMLGRKTALEALSPARRAAFGSTNVDRPGNLTIKTNAMVRVGLCDLLKDVGAFTR